MLRTTLAYNYGEDLLFLDPPETFDSCIVGIAERAGGLCVVAYDKGKCIAALMTCGMDECESVEYFDFNTIGAYMGAKTPVFISPVVV